jgi:putative tryptophan/tyrosine transport system substrate-binding protein
MRARDGEKPPRARALQSSTTPRPWKSRLHAHDASKRLRSRRSEFRGPRSGRLRRVDGDGLDLVVMCAPPWNTPGFRFILHRVDGPDAPARAACKRGAPMIDRRTFVAASGGVLLGLSVQLRAQTRTSTHRIGFVSAFARSEVEAFIAELRPELEKLGWTDGRNIVLLELRTTEGRNERLPAIAAEIVAQSPDLILVQSAPATRALMQATKTIPIVMVGVGNPVEYGMVADLRKPGGNVTGASYLADESMRKTLQLLKEAVPRLRSVAVFSNPSNEGAAPMLKVVRLDAEALGMQLQSVEVTGPGDFENAFAAIHRAKTESILLPPEPLIRTHRSAIAAFAKAHGLALAIVGSSRYLPADGLMSYGPTTVQYAEIAARYVDRILRGAKPRDLPVEQPARFELAINLGTAKTLGLTIPQALQQRADVLNK